jgi:hypothetical protein
MNPKRFRRLLVFAVLAVIVCAGLAAPVHARVHKAMSVFYMVNYSIPYWDQVFREYFVPVVMAASLTAWILSGRRWNAYGFWFIVGWGLVHYAITIYLNGWSEVVPGNPFQVSEGLRDGMIYWARILGWAVVTLSLSAPIWRKSVRRWLGLREGPGASD